MAQKVKSINIIGLFGEHNHQIDFSDNVHVIMGPNGIGKTCVIMLLHALFSGDILKLLDIKYQSIELTYISGEKIKVERTDDEDGDKIFATKYDKDGQIIDSSSDISEKKYIHELMRLRDSEVYGDMVLQRRGRRIVNIKRMEREKLFLIENLPMYTVFNQLRQDLQTQYIPAQRLQMSLDDEKTIERINYISRELEKKITITIDTVAQKSNELDQTFPERLLDVLNDSSVKINTEHLATVLTKIVSIVSSMSSTGLINSTQTLKKEIISKIKSVENKNALMVLDLYLQDYLEKIQLYKPIADKFQLFLSTLNAHFINKKMIIGANKKLVAISTITKEEIPLDRLSSGEQNEMILFYYLIFECDEKHLVLIDEPEISLHIKWLDKLLPIFLKIAKENNLQMLIATHSPDFVGNNTDLLQILSE